MPITRKNLWPVYAGLGYDTDQRYGLDPVATIGVGAPECEKPLVAVGGGFWLARGVSSGIAGEHGGLCIFVADGGIWIDGIAVDQLGVVYMLHVAFPPQTPPAGMPDAEAQVWSIDEKGNWQYFATAAPPLYPAQGQAPNTQFRRSELTTTPQSPFVFQAPGVSGGLYLSLPRSIYVPPGFCASLVTQSTAQVAAISAWGRICGAA